MNESQAIAQVQAQYPDKFVYCFGESANGFDVAVYDSETDFDADASDGDNVHIVARFAIQEAIPL